MSENTSNLSIFLTDASSLTLPEDILPGFVI